MAKKVTRATKLKEAIRQFVMDMRKGQTVHLTELQRYLTEQGISIADGIDKTLIQMLVSLSIKEPKLLSLNRVKTDEFFFARL